MNVSNDKTNGRAIDAPLERRPGVPAKRPPQPVGDAHWTRPPRQEPHTTILKDPSRAELTATFGTSPAPHGLSGLLRRVAYGLPDYRIRRWMLLITADRVDAIEGRIARLARRPLPWLVATSGVAFWLLARKR